MNSALLFAALFAFSVGGGALSSSSAPTNEIPTSLLGTWYSYDVPADIVDGYNAETASGEFVGNLEEYLKGFPSGMLCRTLMPDGIITTTFIKHADGTYTCKMLTTKKNVEWHNIHLNEEFQAEFLNGAQYKIIIFYNATDGTLSVKHTKLRAVEEKPEIDVDSLIGTHMKVGVAEEKPEIDVYLVNTYVGRLNVFRMEDNNRWQVKLARFYHKHHCASAEL